MRLPRLRYNFSSPVACEALHCVFTALASHRRSPMKSVTPLSLDGYVQRLASTNGKMIQEEQDRCCDINTPPNLKTDLEVTSPQSLFIHKQPTLCHQPQKLCHPIDGASVALQQYQNHWALLHGTHHMLSSNQVQRQTMKTALGGIHLSDTPFHIALVLLCSGCGQIFISELLA